MGLHLTSLESLQRRLYNLSRHCVQVPHRKEAFLQVQVESLVFQAVPIVLVLILLLSFDRLVNVRLRLLTH